MILGSESHLVVSDFATPWTIQSMEFSRPNTGVRSFSLLQGIFPTQGSEPMSPPLQVDSLPAEPQGKPKNTGVGSLSLLQQIFLTQELNQGLLHCRWILYQLGYQGSPDTCKTLFISLSQFLILAELNTILSIL